MINFHWMAKGNYFKNELISLMDSIEPYTYKSILLPFQTLKNEPIISASFLANKYKHIKFMVAIRPYTISSLHLAMMVKTFYDLYGYRLIINFVAGTYDNEYKLFTGKDSDIAQRKQILVNYIQDFINHCNGNKYAEIAISGSSLTSIEAVNKFGDYSINLLSDIDKLQNCFKPKMLRVSFAIDKTKEESIFDSEKELNNSFCGTKNDIYKFLNNLEQQGVTDILISTLFSEINNVQKLHDTLYKYRLEA